MAVRQIIASAPKDEGGWVSIEIIAEFENVHTNRLIASVVDMPAKVRIDSGRIVQLLSNLLGNALAYGDPDAPITVVAKANGRGFEISVANNGRRIPDEAMPLLFTAFHRGKVLPNEKGLGLGLYISQEIARAHSGGIRVMSTAEQNHLHGRISVRSRRLGRPLA
ncbi:sensor histidine kinase [Bradyrhizobium sp. McL0616]|uniref:sensor histidine kinase n=1 Tax=Bradyrhizobium sp. McL0616 TaxID=3415674 RepID=UPI003CF54A0D